MVPYIPWDHGEGTPNTACNFKVNFLEMMLYEWFLRRLEKIALKAEGAANTNAWIW